MAKVTPVDNAENADLRSAACVDASHGAQMQVDEVSGRPNRDENLYRVDRGKLESAVSNAGLALCRSKNIKDTGLKKQWIPWGSTILGTATNDGWVQLGNRYLPMEIGGQPVVVEKVVQTDLTRLVLYSSDTPDKHDFRTMIKTQAQEYDFHTATVSTFKTLLEDAKAVSGTEGLQSIALACHGPKRETNELEWKISEQLVAQSPAGMMDMDNGIHKLLCLLADALVPKDGRVDLFACSLIATQEGQAALQSLESETGTAFAASNNLTGNPKHGGDWIMESHNINVRDLYFSDTADFDGTFSPGADGFFLMLVCGPIFCCCLLLGLIVGLVVGLS